MGAIEDREDWCLGMGNEAVKRELLRGVDTLLDTRVAMNAIVLVSIKYSRTDYIEYYCYGPAPRKRDGNPRTNNHCDEDVKTRDK